MVFGLIGSVLLGLGVILILGHNWDSFDRLTRLLLSLGLLTAAQAAAAYALWRRSGSTAWLEGTAAFLMLAVGASISLVGQTYHLADDFQNFILVWMLLSLPLVYLMRATGVAGMYLAGVLVWLAAVQHLGEMKYAAWVLGMLILPYYWRMIKCDRCANSAVVMSWLLLAFFYNCLGMTWAGDTRLWLILYALLFSATYFVGLLWFGEAGKTWQKPFHIVGLLGSVGMAYFLSCKTVWAAYWRYKMPASASLGEYVAVFGLVILAAGLYVLLRKKGLSRVGLIGGLPLAVGAGYLLQFSDQSGMYASALMSFYLLAVSIGVIVKGVRDTSFGVLNMGMLMLAALILLRFFDASYSFIVRGVVFMLLGAAFLVVNMVMARRKGGRQNDKE